MKQEIIGRLKQFDFSKDFVIDGVKDRHYSYRTFFGRCLSITKEFKERSADNNHTVFIMENSVELLACYFAAMFSGKVATAIDPVKEQDEINRILDSIPDKFIVVDKAGAAKVKYSDLLLETDSFEQTKVDEGEVKDKVISLLESRDFDDDYLLTFTSGTSGNTKGVRHSLTNLLMSADSFNTVFSVNKQSIFGHLMPMTYMAGILNTVIQPFIAGASIVILGRFSPILALSFWQNVAKTAINVLWMSPSMLNILLKLGNEKVGRAYCLSNNILFFIGTAPLQQNTREQFEERYGVTLYASYGLSETLFLSTETKETVQTGRDNVGKILEGVKFRFSEQGEFLVDVPWMFLGYTNENTEEYFDESYYKTGDLADITNNILQITGRCKDLIIKGGMNISAALIEKTVSQLEGVDECAAFGAVNAFQEECVVLAYVSNESDIEKAITAIIIEKLGRNYMIDSYYKVNAIPKNINGKFDKNTLKEQYKSKE